MWSVRAGDDLYVSSPGRCDRRALAYGAGHVRADTMERDVRFAEAAHTRVVEWNPVDEKLAVAVDQASGDHCRARPLRHSRGVQSALTFVRGDA